MPMHFSTFGDCPTLETMQNPHVQKFPCTQKSQCPTTKNQCPTKMSPLPNFTTTKIFDISIHNYQNFSIAMQKEKNSYMTKIKIPTSSCIKNFSPSQNHNRTNFPRTNITYPTKFFTNQISYPQKFANTHKYIHAYTHKILPCP